MIDDEIYREACEKTKKRVYSSWEFFDWFWSLSCTTAMGVKFRQDQGSLSLGEVDVDKRKD